MSDIKKPSSIEEMYKAAEKSQEYTELNAHLESIRNRLRDTTNKPTPEQIQSAYEFIRILKEKTWSKDSQEAYTKAYTRAELKNLKDEVQIYQEIDVELKKMEWVRLSRCAYFWDDHNKIVYFWLKRIDEKNFIIEAANQDGVKLSKSITDLKEMNVFIDQVQASDYEKLKESGQIQVKWAEKPKEQSKDEKIAARLGIKTSHFDNVNMESAVSLISKKAWWTTYSSWEKAWYVPDGVFGIFELNQLNRLSTLYSKNSAFKANVDLLAKDTVFLATETKEAKPKAEEKKLEKPTKWKKHEKVAGYDETKISIPKDELALYKKYLSKDADFNNINIELALVALLKAGWKTEMKFSDWEKLGYSDTLFFTTEKTQLEILNKLSKEVSADKDKQGFIKTLIAYKAERLTIKDYDRETQAVLQYKDADVFKYLSILNEQTSPVSRNQLNYMLENNDEKMVLCAVSKIILTWGWEALNFTSKAELYNALKCNPALKMHFQKWLYRITSSSLDINQYISKWWDTKDQLDSVNKFSESVWIELDKLFDEKFSKAIDTKISQVKADPKLSDKEKNDIVSKLENSKTNEKDSIKSFFKLKSIGLIWSIIKWKEWAGGLVVFWNNSTNEIIRSIDLEVGIWTFGWTTLPVLGLSTSWAKSLSKKIDAHGRVWVWVFWAYVIWGLDYQINYSTVENAKIEWFDTKKRTVGVYWDAWITFFGWIFSYGWGVQYKEKLSEWFKQKREMLGKTLNMFNSVKVINDIDKLDLKIANKEEESMIKQDIKNIMLWLGFRDDLSDKNKKALIEASKQAKLWDFDKISAVIGSEKWITFSWVWLWVQFIAGFFPIIVGWISFEKNTIKKEKARNFIPVELKSSESHSVNAETISKKFKKYWIKMNYSESTWLYELSPLSALAALNMYATPAAKSNMKIKWDSLLIGQVDSMLLNESIDEEQVISQLYFWGKSGTSLDIWAPDVVSTLQNNTPKSYITFEETSSSLKSSFESWRVKMMYDDYLKANRSLFNETMLSAGSQNWLEYNRFRNSLSIWNLEESRAALLRFLNNYSKYSKKSSAETKKVIEHISLVKDNFELAKTLADFKDILMVDIYTRTRRFETQEDLDIATGKILEVLNERGMVEKLAKADTKAKQDKLIKSMNSRELAALKKTTWWLDTQNMEGNKDLNRKWAFGRLSKRFLWSNSDAMIAARQEQDDYKREHLSAWWVPKESKNVFALVGSYKVARNNEGNYTNVAKKWREKYSSKWFDAMPPGTVSIANDKKSELKNVDTKALLDDFASRTVYFEIVRRSLLEHINANLKDKISDKDFTVDKLKELILNKKVEINWKKIEMKSSFIFFMYWECNNESYGLEFGEITLEVTWKRMKIAPVAFGEWSSTETQRVIADTYNLSLGMVWGEGKEHQVVNSTSIGWTEWTGTTTTWDTWWANF